MRSSESPPGRTTGGSNKFSSTPRLAKMPRSSGQNATPARAIFSGGRPISSRPSKRIEPLRLATSPMIERSVVVLPAPLRPSSVTTSPCCTSKVTPCKMCDSPYQACTSASDKSAARASSMADTQIGFAHFRIFRNHIVVTLGQNATAGKHGDAVAQVRHHREIVLDHQHRAIDGDALNQRTDAVDILVRHASGRLVEQQHFRIERQSRGDLQGALAA